MTRNWQDILSLDSPIQSITAISGGDVNQAYRLDTADRPYFLLLQTNQSKAFYEGEVASLKELAKADITVPQVIDYGETQGDAYLLLTYLEEGYTDGRNTTEQAALGYLVAKMHHYHSVDGRFGFDYPHQGSHMQFSNQWTDSWIELFVENRMDKLRDRLLEDKLWKENDRVTYEEVRSIMVNELNRHQSTPSLLHGDLWAGNYMIQADGQPALFDPSSFYGDREFDLGATLVFGGFTDDFYQAYHQAYPLDDGYDLRIEFYRLYLLLVHLVKFKGPYGKAVDQSMARILNYM